MDRIFDDATVFNIKGERFRGKRLQTSRVKAPASSETPALYNSNKPIWVVGGFFEPQLAVSAGL